MNEIKERRSKFLVLGPGERRTFWLSSRTPHVPFYVLSRTKPFINLKSYLNNYALVIRFFLNTVNYKKKLRLHASKFCSVIPTLRSY